MTFHTCSIDERLAGQCLLEGICIHDGDTLEAIQIRKALRPWLQIPQKGGRPTGPRVR